MNTIFLSPTQFDSVNMSFTISNNNVQLSNSAVMSVKNSNLVLNLNDTSYSKATLFGSLITQLNVVNSTLQLIAYHGQFVYGLCDKLEGQINIINTNYSVDL